MPGRGMGSPPTAQTASLGSAYRGPSVAATHRFWPGLVVILLGSSVAVGHVQAPVSATEPPKPNILLIVTDDQRATGTLGIMPKTRGWFVSEGTKYSNGFVSTPVCCPSRASVFTGRYAHNHGVYKNTDAENLDHDITIQRYLGDAGYGTAIAGKFLNQWDLSQPPPHFDRWAILGGGYYNAHYNVDGIELDVPAYSTTFLKTYALSVIDYFEVRDASPWFLVIAPTAPHRPFVAEERYADAPVGSWAGNPAVKEKDRSDKPLYVRKGDASLEDGRRLRRLQLRTLLSVDDLVDEVMQHLETVGELDRTLAVYTSDNGFLWAEHGRTGKGMPYTEAVKVPFLLRWPGEVEEGVVDGRLAMNIDIAPTLMEVAGLSPDVPMDGRSLLSGETRSRLLIEQFSGTGPWAALRTKRYHYIEYYDTEGEVRFREHYRLLKDPWQLRNVFGDGKKGNEPNKAELHEKLEQARSCVGTTGSDACS